MYVYDECDRRDLDRNRDLLKNSLSEKLTVAYGILKAAHTLEQTRAAERAATISKLVVHDGVFHADDVLPEQPESPSRKVRSIIGANFTSFFIFIDLTFS